MNSSDPLISVIIPVFNRSWQLKRALESLKSQTYQDFEVIVCDDGSTENIASVVKDFEESLNIHLIQMPNWGGPARPRNKGLAFSRGKWVSFLDSDDWWDFNRLEIVAEQLNDSIDVLYHPLRVLRESVITKSREKRKQIGDPIFGLPFEQMMLYGNPLPTSATVIRKDLLIKNQGMSEDRALIALEDFDCWLRLAKAGARFYFADQCLGSYWVGADAISKVSQRNIDAQNLLFSRHQANLTGAIRAKALARQNYVLGTLYYRLHHPEEALQYFWAASPLSNPKLFLKKWFFIAFSLLRTLRNVLN